MPEVESAIAPARLQRLGSWLLNQAGLRATRVVGRSLTAAGGRRDQYLLMVALDELGSASQADLGRRLTMDRSDMSALVDELSEAGIVVRERDEQDRRRNVVRLTDAGRVRMEELSVVVDAAQDELLAPLSEAERDELAGLLRRLVEHHR